MRVNAKLIALFIILAVVFATVVGIVSATPGNGNGNDCQGNSCDDVPGNECENGQHVGNPHCDPEDTDDPGDDDDEDCPGASCDDVPGDECENGQHEGNPHCDDQDDPGDDDGDDDDDECPIDADNCPDDGGDDDDNPGDDGDTPRGNQPSTSEPAQGPTCTDVFHPFLANQDASVSWWAAAGFMPAAEAFVVNAEWQGNYTDVSSLGAQLLIVPADYRGDDRDLIRDGNDAGILCPGALQSSPAIVAFVVNGEVMGLVLVTDNGNDVYVNEASILRWDVLTFDVLFDGIPGTLEADRWDQRP